MPNNDGLVTSTIFNTKIGEVENKIPGFSGLFKKTDYNAKISDIEKKYLLLLIIINLQKKPLDAKIKEKGLFDKFNIFMI